MEILAIALLRVPPQVEASSVPARIVPLDDAILLHTGQSFGEDPEELSSAVRELLGDELVDAHEDERGIFFIPSVAEPSARTYEGVIAEVADGGVWGPADVDTSPFGDMAAGSLGALLGGILQQMPSGVLESAAAAVRGQPGALEAASSQLKAAADSGGLDIAKLGAMLENSGIDMNAMQSLVGQMQSALQRDPAGTAALAEKLFNEKNAAEEAEEDPKR